MMQQPNALQSVFFPSFDKDWERLGLTKAELDALASDLMVNPKAGAVIRGTGGTRKFRYALANRGKSAGARIIYADFSEYNRLYFIKVYSKHEKANLTGRECNELKKLMKILEQKLREKSQ